MGIAPRLMAEVVEPQPGEAANPAFVRHAWRGSHERFAEADHEQTFATSGARTVELKGIAEPLEVLAVSWR